MVSPPTVVIWSAQQPSYTLQRHRRRIKTEEKGKVVASVWGGRMYIQFLVALAVLPRMILKNRI